MVVHALHTFDPLYDALGVILQSGPGDFTGQNHRAAIDPESEVIEYAVVRQHQQFMPNLAFQVCVRLGYDNGRPSREADGRTYYQNQNTSKRKQQQFSFHWFFLLSFNDHLGLRTSKPPGQAQLGPGCDPERHDALPCAGPNFPTAQRTAGYTARTGNGR